MFVSKRFFRRGVYHYFGFVGTSKEKPVAVNGEKHLHNAAVLSVFSTLLLAIWAILLHFISHPETAEQIRAFLWK